MAVFVRLQQICIEVDWERLCGQIDQLIGHVDLWNMPRFYHE